jgi:cell division topological specificity factor
MNLLSLFNKRTTAPVARDRLQILLAHERVSTGGNSDLVSKLRVDILAAVAKHLSIDEDKVIVKMDRGATVSTLEVDIEIPNTVAPLRKAVGA